MKYMGSKTRIAKHLLPIILKGRKDGQWYVEPFVGGANMIDKVVGNRIGADNNKYLIALYKGFQDNVDVSNIKLDKESYSSVRDFYNGNGSESYSDFHVGYVGYMASANGRFFEGGYSGKSNTKVGTVRDYIDESLRGLIKQIPSLSETVFVSAEYKSLRIPPKSIIYCDPPYKGTKQYATSKAFNHDEFWQWCRDKHNEGHTVFISEYNAPLDFECVWMQEVKSSLSANGVAGGSKVSVERLFQYKKNEEV